MPVRETACIDGRMMPLADAALPMADQGVVRGDGAFETVGVWSGRPFRLGAHLERLNASLRSALLPEADPAALAGRVADVLEHALDDETIDAMIRLYVTASGTQIVLVSGQPDRPPHRRLDPVVAPWIRPRGTYVLSGAKTMSYMPNMVTSRVVQRDGADDALLLSSEGWVLEGPTFGVVWMADGVLHAPGVELGIVDSISRRTVIALAESKGIEVRTGAWPLDVILQADEVMTSSAVRPLQALQAIGDQNLPEDTPVARLLAAALAEERHSAV
jgi:branched-subunit amino acid aminotransferase/4-amino-4-deoxychorismate lyase